MIKKIYSAVNADEVQAMLANGCSVHGYVGYVLDGAIYKQAMVKRERHEQD